MDNKLVMLLPLIIVLIIAIILIVKYVSKPKEVKKELLKSVNEKIYMKNIIDSINAYILENECGKILITLEEQPKNLIDEVKKFGSLSTCESTLELIDYDFVLKSSYIKGDKSVLDFVVNTKNNFYVFNSISNAIMVGDNSKLTGFNIDLQLYFDNKSNGSFEPEKILINKFYLTKNTELKF